VGHLRAGWVSHRVTAARQGRLGAKKLESVRGSFYLRDVDDVLPVVVRVVGHPVSHGEDEGPQGGEVDVDVLRLL
jgi:hypothetical protein